MLAFFTLLNTYMSRARPTRHGLCPQSGNVLFLVLIGVVLFAALSYAIMASNRGGGKDLSDDKAKLAAAEILQHFATIRQAIERVKTVNKCANEEITFTSPDIVVTNANSPSSQKCHIFYPAGGGVSRVKFNKKYFDATKFLPSAQWYVYASLPPYNYTVGFNAYNRQRNIATTSNGVDSVDLLGILYGVSDAVCKAVNRSQGVNAPTYAPPNADLHVAATYTGTFSDSYVYNPGAPIVCTYSAVYSANFVTYPLIER